MITLNKVSIHSSLIPGAMAPTNKVFNLSFSAFGEGIGGPPNIGLTPGILEEGPYGPAEPSGGGL